MQIAERNPHMVNLASQGRRVHKRQSSYSNIRIHPVFTNGIFYNANVFLRGDDTPLARAINTIQNILLVRPVQGNLIIPPKCKEYTYGLNKGKCESPLSSQNNYKCGPYGVVPLSYIGTREVCLTYDGSCTTQGPDNPGLPNADYLLFISVSARTQLSFLFNVYPVFYNSPYFVSFNG